MKLTEFHVHINKQNVNKNIELFIYYNLFQFICFIKEMKVTEICLLNTLWCPTSFCANVPFEEVASHHFLLWS